MPPYIKCNPYSQTPFYFAHYHSYKLLLWENGSVTDYSHKKKVKKQVLWKSVEEFCFFVKIYMSCFVQLDLYDLKMGIPLNKNLI